MGFAHTLGIEDLESKTDGEALAEVEARGFLEQWEKSIAPGAPIDLDSQTWFRELPIDRQERLRAAVEAQTKS